MALNAVNPECGPWPLVVRKYSIGRLISSGLINHLTPRLTVVVECEFVNKVPE